MTHGDGHDFSDQGIPDNEAPVPSGGSEAALDHPLADNEFNFAEFIERLQLAFERIKDAKSVLIVLVAVSSFWLIWDLTVGMAQTVGSVFGLDWLVGIVAFILQIILFPVIFLIAGYQATLYKPFAEKLFDGATEVGTAMEVAKAAVGDFVKAVIAVLGVMVPTVLTICCPPASLVIAFVFGQAPYLVVFRDRSIGDAFKESFERAKNHWHVLIMAAAFMFAVICVAALPALLVYGVAFVGGIIWVGFSYLIGPVAWWIFGILITVAGFIISTTAFATIDELEGLGTIDPDLM